MYQSPDRRSESQAGVPKDSLQVHWDFEAICGFNGIKTGILDPENCGRNAYSRGDASTRFLAVCPECHRAAIQRGEDSHMGQGVYRIHLSCWFCAWEDSDLYTVDEMRDLDSAFDVIERTMRSQADELARMISEQLESEKSALEFAWQSEISQFCRFIDYVEPDDF